MQYNVRLIALALFLIVVPFVLSAPLGERVRQLDSTNSHLADRAEAKDHVLGTISAQGLFDGLGLGSLPIVGDVLSPVFNIVDGVSGEIMGVLKGILPAELLEQLKGALHPVDGVPIVGGLLDGLLGDLSVNGTSAKNATDIPKNALNVAQLAAISSVLHTMTLVLGSPTAIASQVLPAVTGLAGQTPAAQVINAARGVTGNSPSPLDTVAGIAGIPLGAIQGATNVAPLPAAPINALADVIPATGILTAAMILPSTATGAAKDLAGAVDPTGAPTSAPAHAVIAAAHHAAMLAGTASSISSSAAHVPGAAAAGLVGGFASGAIPMSQLIGDKIVPVVGAAETATSIVGQATQTVKSAKEAAPLRAPTDMLANGTDGLVKDTPAQQLVAAADTIKDIAPAPVQNAVNAATAALPTDVVHGAVGSATGTLGSLTGASLPLQNIFGGL